VAAAAHLRPTEHALAVGADRARCVDRAATERETPIQRPNRGGRPR
jgi:hypothetical protein